MASTRRRLRRAAQRRARRAQRGIPSGRVLRALTAGTLALPGVARAGAEFGELGIGADYKFSQYTEDSLSQSKVSIGSRDRYEIDVHQFHLGVPIGERFSADLNIAHEIMSGATPWYVEPNPGGGDPLQVMTGATVDEQRTDVLGKGTMLFDRGTAALSGGVSFENDYMSFNGGLEGERFFNEKNTTLSGGLGVSYDMIEPTDSDIFQERVDKETKQGYSLFGGVSQVLGKNAAISSTLQYQLGHGFLSDPYKRAYVVSLGGPINDARPDIRHQFSWLTRYRQHLSYFRGTLHADYRLYLDDWGVNAHTFEVAWYQMLWSSFRLIPSVRYYSQSQAEFYAPVFISERSDDLYTSDYRLSPYGALSWRVKAETRFQLYNFDLILNIGWERYFSGGDLALGKVTTENPGLVSYNMWSAGITTKF
jgi:hypothetical protein